MLLRNRFIRMLLVKETREIFCYAQNSYFQSAIVPNSWLFCRIVTIKRNSFSLMPCCFHGMGRAMIASRGTVTFLCTEDRTWKSWHSHKQPPRCIFCTYICITRTVYFVWMGLWLFGDTWDTWDMAARPGTQYIRCTCACVDADGKMVLWLQNPIVNGANEENDSPPIKITTKNTWTTDWYCTSAAERVQQDEQRMWCEQSCERAASSSSLSPDVIHMVISFLPTLPVPSNVHFLKLRPLATSFTRISPSMKVGSYAFPPNPASLWL